MALRRGGGCTPLQALQAATLGPARWLAAPDSLGLEALLEVARRTVEAMP